MIERGGAPEHPIHGCHFPSVPITQVRVAGRFVAKKLRHRSHRRDIPSRDDAMRSKGATREVRPNGSSAPTRDCSLESNIVEDRLAKAGGCEEDRFDQQVEKALDRTAHRCSRLALERKGVLETQTKQK